MYRRDRRDTDDYVECQHENLIPCYNYLYCDSISKRICYNISPVSTNGQVYKDSPQNGGHYTGIGRDGLNNGDSGLSTNQNVENTMTNAAQGLVNGDYRQSFVYNQNGDQNQQTVDHKNLNINIPTTTQRQHFNKPNINRDQNSPTTKSTKVLNR